MFFFFLLLPFPVLWRASPENLQLCWRCVPVRSVFFSLCSLVFSFFCFFFFCVDIPWVYKKKIKRRSLLFFIYFFKNFRVCGWCSVRQVIWTLDSSSVQWNNIFYIYGLLTESSIRCVISTPWVSSTNFFFVVLLKIRKIFFKCSAHLGWSSESSSSYYYHYIRRHISAGRGTTTTVCLAISSFFPSSSWLNDNTRKRWYLCRRDFWENCVFSLFSGISSGRRDSSSVWIFVFWNLFSRTLFSDREGQADNYKHQLTKEKKKKKCV